MFTQKRYCAKCKMVVKIPLHCDYCNICGGKLHYVIYHGNNNLKTFIVHINGGLHHAFCGGKMHMVIAERKSVFFCKYCGFRMEVKHSKIDYSEFKFEKFEPSEEFLYS